VENGVSSMAKKRADNLFSPPKDHIAQAQQKLPQFSDGRSTRQSTIVEIGCWTIGITIGTQRNIDHKCPQGEGLWSPLQEDAPSSSHHIIIVDSVKTQMEQWERM
jgi:hypothetical protein